MIHPVLCKIFRNTDIYRNIHDLNTLKSSKKHVTNDKTFQIKPHLIKNHLFKRYQTIFSFNP